jgi:hypothetical protein
LLDLTPPFLYGASSHGAGSSARNSSIRLPNRARTSSRSVSMSRTRERTIYRAVRGDRNQQSWPALSTRLSDLRVRGEAPISDGRVLVDGLSKRAACRCILS